MLLHKVATVGNRFLLADANQTGEQDWSTVAMRVCWGVNRDRAEWDGLLVVSSRPELSPTTARAYAEGVPSLPTRWNERAETIGESPESEEDVPEQTVREHFQGETAGTTGREARLGLRMFNPDGTEDFCGNGLICAAAYAWLTGLAQEDRFDIYHRGHLLPVRLNLEQGKLDVVTVALPPPSVRPRDIPILHDEPLPEEITLSDFPYPIRVVSTGTPHAVILVDELPDDEKFFRLSKTLELHPVFPERTSLEWVRSLLPGKVEIRIWERGVGETEGCGSGAAAVAAVTYGRLHDGVLEVVSKGGMLQVEWPGSGPVLVTGRPQISLSYAGSENLE